MRSFIAVAVAPLLSFVAPSLAHSVDDPLEITTTKEVNCTRHSLAGDSITVHYRGTLAFDGSQFDSSYDYGHPFTFTLGAGQVIKGWDEGLVGMCVGEHRTLVIPPKYGYGDRTVGPIPGGSTLIFETELMGIEGVQPYVEGQEKQAEASSTQPVTAATSTPAKPEGQASSKPDTQDPPANDEDDDGKCHLLGSFSLVVQGALGALALLSLVWKRYRETPRRPLKIWWFDVSKQVFGSVLLHIANLFMSMLSSGTFDVKNVPRPGPPTALAVGDKTAPNPCSFYLLNLAIDTTLGIPILVVLLRVLHALFLKTPLARPPQSIRSGNYGNPPRRSWWFKQSIIYFLGLFGMKLCVFFIFQLLPWIAWVGDWALRWTEGNQKIQITFVMFIFPVVMNALQYYIIDSFIKERAGGHPEDDRGEHRPLAQNDDEDSDMEEDHRRDRAFAVGDEDEEEEDENARMKSNATAAPLKEANPTAIPTYDNAHPSRGSSSDGGRSARRTKE